MLDKLLNLEGVVIQGYKQLENIGIVFKIQSHKQQAICPYCAKISNKLHQNHWHLVKDLPMSGQEVFLKVNLGESLEKIQPFYRDFWFHTNISLLEGWIFS